MNEIIQLHGGPNHGERRSIQQNRDHFHILGVIPGNVDHILKPAEDGEDLSLREIPKREGMYSRVGRSSDFEWDGWRSHD